MDVTQGTYRRGEKNCDPIQSNMMIIMTWKQFGNSLTTANVLAEINRGWLKNGVQMLIGYGYLQNTIYRNTFYTSL